MTKNELTDKIYKILLESKIQDYSDCYLEIEKIGKENDFQIKYGQMYEAPILNFGTLKELSELFGTDNIDVDDYSYRGCDTCDYGSDYGHEIQVRNPTKTLEVLDYVGKLY